MKYFIVNVLFLVLTSSNVIAGETKILFDKYEVPGQVSQDYYIKGSIKNVNKKTPHVFEVSTYRTVTSSDGTTIYKSTFEIDCKNKQYKFIKLWSSGFGYDYSSIDGKWHPSSEYPDTKALTENICNKN